MDKKELFYKTFGVNYSQKQIKMLSKRKNNERFEYYSETNGSFALFVRRSAK